MLYTGDWLADPAVSKCAPATRGIWIDALCAMHEGGRTGRLEGTVEQMARILRCTPAEFESAKADLKATKTADVTERNGAVTLIVTLINRRMLREHKKREQSRLRVNRFRRYADVTQSVTKNEQECNSPLSVTVPIPSPDPMEGNPLSRLEDWQLNKDLKEAQNLLTNELDSCGRDNDVVRAHRARRDALRAELKRRGAALKKPTPTAATPTA
jgi:hypothetical protein